MTRWNVICTWCGETVKFRHAGDVCDSVHGSPYIIECDCTGVPAENWPDVEEPLHWEKNEEVYKIVKKSSNE